MKKSSVVCTIAICMALLFVFMNDMLTANTSNTSLTFTVNSTIDATNANPGNGVCETVPGNGVCTLRAAIQEANALPGANEIILPAGTYLLTIEGTDEDDAATGDLDIKEELTITGANASTTIIDGNGIDRVFHVFAETNFSNITIQNGQGYDPSMLSCGGGGIRIQNYVGNVTIENSVIRNNQAVSNNAGGGICMLASDRTLTLINSVIDGNTAVGRGGGIFMGFPGDISLINSTVSNNQGWYGGGIQFFAFGLGSNVLSLETSHIISNTATGGGGGVSFNANGSQLHIVASNISGNQVPSFGQNQGGGILISGQNNAININHSILSNNASNAYHGGGLATTATNSTFSINNSTFTDNVAFGAGGALYSSGSITLDSQDTTFSNNTAGGWGGAIYTGNLTHTVSITNGRFLNNSLTNTDSWGGAINMRSLTTTLSLVNSTFVQNTANTFGGAVYLFPNTSTIDMAGITANIVRTSFVQNEVFQAYGGAIFQGRGTTVHVNQSAFVGNKAIGGGAYAALSADDMAGSALTHIANVTFSDNRAFWSGGAIIGLGMPTSMTIRNATIANNVADSNAGTGYGGGFSVLNDANILVSNSIIANNTDGSGESPNCNNPGTQASDGWNLIGDDTGCNWSASTGDLVGTAVSPIDPLLEPLTGSLPYHPLQPDSPVIDAGNPGAVGGPMPSCLQIDQIGRIRPIDGNGDGIAVCDIGAIEYSPDSINSLFLPVIVK
jgi:CSLREA domain-containing protein